MVIRTGHCTTPFFLMHGGAGPEDPKNQAADVGSELISRLAREVIELKKTCALDTVQACLEKLEADPIFNAGLGSALQGDGLARLTAAIMDGENQTFAAVHGLMNHIHPSSIARYLLKKKSRVIGQPGVQQLAHKLGLPFESPVTQSRQSSWEKRLASGLDCDTVGAVCIDVQGHMAAGTSTGGRGFEFPGRMSDCGTAAGNYASSYLAVSCTGVGEQIVDAGLSVRLETRVRDGMTLVDACQLCLEEAKARNHQYGWIAIDHRGFWAICHTTPCMIYAGVNGADFLVTSEK